MEGTASVPEFSTVEAGQQLHSITTRGTKRDSSYESLSQVPVVDIPEDEASSVDEFILNSSLDEVLGGDSGPLPPSYEDLKAFMEAVSVLTHTMSN